jgi:flagellar basal-body rod modification protein FlgD
VNVNGTGGVGPGTTASAQQRPGAQLGKDQFLQLLVAQLRHQDPLNPSDPKEFAAQLAQFSSLEQLINMGEQLKIMSATDRVMVEMLNGNSAVAVIGRDILAYGDVVEIGADAPGSVTFEVGGTGGSARIRIFDENDREVGSRDLGAVTGGRNTIELGDLNNLPPGVYRYSIEVSNGGEPVAVRTYTAGHVTGIQYTGEGPVLVCGGVTGPLGAVVSVTARKYTVAANSYSNQETQHHDALALRRGIRPAQSPGPHGRHR